MNAPKNQVADTARAQTAELEDRRKWSRIPDAENSAVRFSTSTLGEQRGQLTEVALGGFALRVTDASGLLPGQEVTVYFEEGVIRAIIKYVLADGETNYRVGMEWIQPRSPTVISLLRRCFEG